MNILVVADVSASKVIGGAERVLYEQTTRLRNKGHKVHILTRKTPDHKTNHEKISGVKEWRYECNYKSQLLFLKSNIINGKLFFEKLHNKYLFDCINFHQPFTAFGVLQSSISKNIAKFYTCHSLSYEEYISRNSWKKFLFSRQYNYLQVRMRKWIEKKNLNESDKIVVLSQFTKKKLSDIYRIPSNKISIIHGGVDLDRFKLLKNGNSKRKNLGIPENKIIIFTVRNLVKRMGLENLILAFKQIINIAPDIELIIGGDGPLKTHLIALTKSLGLEKKIHFTGFIQDDQLPSYYQCSDLFVLPTIELEGFGLVTLEALASGLPVLGTPVGGTKEILSRFNPGFLFENTRPESIANKVIETCKIIKENERKWKEISYQCCDFIKQNYSWKRNVDSLEELFMRTLNK